MLVERSQNTDGSIVTLTLNDPDHRNALSSEMMATISDAMTDLTADKQARVAVLAARGSAFCAGHDLKELTAHRTDEDGGARFFRDTMQQCSAMMLDIVRCPKPIIARVQGIATAAGCQLVASCDLAVAESKARFATPGVNLGLFCSTPMVAISRNLSRKHTMEMLLTGETLAAERAAELGLVNSVASIDELDTVIGELAERIASRSHTAIRIGKEAYYRQLDMDLASAYDYVSEVMVTNMLEEDAVEGIGAFLEKREPTWE